MLEYEKGVCVDKNESTFGIHTETTWLMDDEDVREWNNMVKNDIFYFEKKYS